MEFKYILTEEEYVLLCKFVRKARTELQKEKIRKKEDNEGEFEIEEGNLKEIEDILQI